MYGFLQVHDQVLKKLLYVEVLNISYFLQIQTGHVTAWLIKYNSSYDIHNISGKLKAKILKLIYYNTEINLYMDIILSTVQPCLVYS